MKNILIILFLFSIFFYYSCENSFTNKKVVLKNRTDTISYSLGVNIGEKIKAEGAEEINSEVLIVALNQVLSEDSLLINEEQATNILRKYFATLKKKESKQTHIDGEAFLKQNKNNKNIYTLESGLQYKIIKQGTGKIPVFTDMITMHFTGSFIDGTIFDNTFDKKPVTFPINKSIKAWQEALIMMPVGSTWELYIPPELAYGKEGSGDVIKPNTVLIYKIKLIEINTPH